MPFGPKKYEVHNLSLRYIKKIKQDVSVSSPIGGPLLVAPLVLVQTMDKSDKSFSILNILVQQC